MGIAMARGAATVTDDVYAILCRVALDTMPSMRARLLQVLWGLRYGFEKTATVADKAEVPTDTAKVWLDDLRLLGITERGGDPSGAYRWCLRPDFRETVTRAGLALDGPDDDGTDEAERQAVMALEAEEGIGGDYEGGTPGVCTPDPPWRYRKRGLGCRLPPYPPMW